MYELEILAGFIHDLKLENLDKKVIDAAKLCVLDTFGAAAGATRDPLIQKIVSTYQSLYPGGGDAAVWGFEKKMPFLQAAFLNGMMGHRLELDDVHTSSKTHIGTVVVPAAFALSQHLDLTGAQFLEAVICGYEVMSRIGMGFGVSSHRNRGWHVTSTAGTFGAAAAAAKLLGLDAEKTVHALGMAGTQSFGVWAFLEDSASSKILHPGRAAVSGIEAALLAKSGMTGPTKILSAFDGGLFKAMSDEYSYTAVTEGLGKDFEILKVDIKPYPCCRSTHCAIDAALYLSGHYPIASDEIKKIEVETYLVGYKQCGLTEGSLKPKTPVDAKFSIPYTVAAALLKGTVNIESFLPEAIQDPAVQSLLSKVEVRPEETFTSRYPKHWGCRAIITMNSGDTYETEIKDALGSVDQPLTPEDLNKKVEPLIKVAYDDPKMIIQSFLEIEALKLSDMA
ncbi:MmgE/PrpD family protein [Acidaminobacter hydrogenoformans]|uniref:2-methylcitrate dehydratase PrpD n=1 Tax=Acidaminobacter hydrogenoformans DSM 2784 TaxID=1120920 RepID=A0A1G5S5W6_9FIRM|nr:MmgE/PrpD family protein [Acidaminobacter hydrogenoformans]SCZ81802.1 2-methylcitrate dehydratase PrpD [Acidaminobacter hydrogenoformans DSM 2784]